MYEQLVLQDFGVTCFISIGYGFFAESCSLFGRSIAVKLSASQIVAGSVPCCQESGCAALTPGFLWAASPQAFHFLRTTESRRLHIRRFSSEYHFAQSHLSGTVNTLSASNPHSAKPASVTERIRVTLVIPTLDQSGAERQLSLLATGLPADQFDVDVVALNRGGFFADRLREHQIPVTVLNKRFRFDPFTWFHLRRHIARRRPHLVQSWLFAANTYVRAPGVCPDGTQVIVSERCVDSWKQGWQLALDRRLRSNMVLMTANSESVAQFYRDTVGVAADRIRVIPNGLPATSTENAADLRQELGLDPDAKLIGFAGRLASQKRLEDLIWGFHLLQQVIENTYLVLIGDGPERDALAGFSESSRSREKVFFCGHRPDAASVISQLDLFCLTSGFEGMSNSLMEAMAVGVPCLVSDISSNRELIKHEQTGWLFPVGDSVALCRQATKILQDPESARAPAEAARKRMTQKHSVESMVQRHIDVYRELVPASESV